jgi:hypothetical protein
MKVYIANYSYSGRYHSDESHYVILAEDLEEAYEIALELEVGSLETDWEIFEIASDPSIKTATSYLVARKET